MVLLEGDCREVLKTLPDNSVDSVVTDPPYHLTTGKKGGSGPASVNLDSPYGRARVTTGFMGMTWDGGDIAQNSEVWRECLRVLKPGGHLLAFSGTRTQHRMVCAIEDAGFEIRDQVGWCFGSGFPKSHNGPWGGTALKPAWEPICMARKPLIGTVSDNYLAHGTGALNIDGCRVGTSKDVPASVSRGVGGTSLSGSVDNSLRKEDGSESGHNPNVGRWPANLIHDGSDEVVALFPQTGARGNVNPTKSGVGMFNSQTSEQDGFARDSGSAARFFYCPKASRKDRGEGCDHPTVKPTDLMRYLCRLVTPPGGTVLDPFMGSGSTGKAALLEGFDFIGIELSPEYVEIARRRIDAGMPLFREVA